MRTYLIALTLLLVPSVALATDSSPRVVAKIRVGSQPCAGVAAFGSFWETNYGTATLSRVNPATNRVTKTGRLGAQPCGIAAGAGSIWIDGYGTSRIERINRKTLKVTKRIKVGTVSTPRWYERSRPASSSSDTTVISLSPASTGLTS